MIIIQEVLISDDIVEKEFVCNIKRCKGACCWEGDYGAPVTSEEEEAIMEMLPNIIPRLTEEAKILISKDGPITSYNKGKFRGTTLLRDGSCAFLVKNELGQAQCSFEQYHREQPNDFKKPISCHLYPIRVSENEHTGFKAMNYDKWDICSDACALGEELKIPIYQFVKEAIIRAFDESFFEELDAYAQHKEGRSE